MLRVCGITLSHSPNYGSCLQTYALQHAIESLKIHGEECIYQVIPIQMLKDYPMLSLKQRIAKPLLAWNRMQYQSFYKKYMKYANCTYIKDLAELNQQYDAFTCGSDVIWKESMNLRIGAYFLDFAEKYHFSYAASFGKAEISDDYLRFIAEKIDRLDMISVRESSAVQIVKRCTKKPVKVVADPVLLVDRANWEQIAEKTDSSDPYIFVYVTHLNDTIKQFLAKLKEVTGLRIMWAVAGPKQAFRQGLIQVQKPERWLGLLCNAEYVITNSFHATAFSVLFHKKFFTVVAGEKNQGINVRMNDFLNMVNLGDRIYSSVPERLNLSEVDFKEADDRIFALKEESLAYLRENLEMAYQQKQRNLNK